MRDFLGSTRPEQQGTKQDEGQKDSGEATTCGDRVLSSDARATPSSQLLEPGAERKPTFDATLSEANKPYESVSTAAQLGSETSKQDAHAAPPLETSTPLIDGFGATVAGPDISVRDAAQPLAASFPVSGWDKYEFLSILGRGGMGAVYKARDLRLDRIVALKFIRGDDPLLAKRFLQEAHTQACLDHPNLCRIYEVGQVDGKPYIAMQFVDGQSLDRMRDELTLHDKVAIIREAALALHEAHRLGIVHRDIKPANIMVELSSDGRPRPIVMDFGLARESGKNRGLTETGTVIGTPAYMPPEQARGNARQLDRRADVYSLGATLYELLTKRPPFIGEQVVDVILAVLSDEPTPVRVLAPEIPIDLETIVLKCLAKEPSERYDSTRALAEDLQRYIDGEPIQGKAKSQLSRLWRYARRHKTISLSILGFLLTLPVVYGAAQHQTRQESSQRMNRDIVRGSEALATARAKNVQVEALYKQAYALFDSQKVPAGETTYTQAQELALEADRTYSGASQFFEAVVTTDHTNAQARELLGDTLYERALMAERDRRSQQLDDLLQRLGLYDPAGIRRARWSAPGHIRITTTPTARAMLKRYVSAQRRRRVLSDAKELGVTPIADVALAPGSYLLTLTAPGRITVEYPFMVMRGTPLHIQTSLPELNDVPPDFAFIPAGPFLFGTVADETMRKSFLSTVPIHTVQTEAYLIARHETTYGEWIEYLNALSPAKRAQLTLPAMGGVSFGGVTLKQLPNGKWQIELKPVATVLIAKAGEPIVYPTRSLHKQQNWLRMPAGGITFDQGREYAHWLDITGKQPGARLCNDHEWERAARGADDREWPNGDELAAQDANHDMTYDKDPGAMGPDEVGSYPQSRSPFGVDDMAGNVMEWAESKLNQNEPIVRSGSFWYLALAQRSTNRTSVDQNFRDPNIGLRICTTPPQPKSDK